MNTPPMTGFPGRPGTAPTSLLQMAFRIIQILSAGALFSYGVYKCNLGATGWGAVCLILFWLLVADLIEFGLKTWDAIGDRAQA